MYLGLIGRKQQETVEIWKILSFMICILTASSWGNQIYEEEMGGSCGTC